MEIDENITLDPDLADTTDEQLESATVESKLPRFGRFSTVILVTSLLISGLGIFVYLSVGKS